MTAAFGFLVVFIVVVVFPLTAGWFFFHHRGRVHGITTISAARGYLRKDLDVGPLTMWRVNLVYRSVMRRTGVKNANGKPMQIRKVTLAMPVEDYSFVQQVGLDGFVLGLRDYRHEYALKQGWYPPGHDPVPVAVWPDERCKRLRPEPSYEWAHDGTTRTITSRARHFSDGDRTRSLKATARLTFKDQTWELVPQDAPYRLGRGEANHIRTVHDTISSQHAIIRYSGEVWVLDPLDGTTNETKIGGRVITSPTPLTPGTLIMIGEAEPIRFDGGSAADPNDATETRAV